MCGYFNFVVILCLAPNAVVSTKYNKTCGSDMTLSCTEGKIVLEKMTRGTINGPWCELYEPDKGSQDQWNDCSGRSRCVLSTHKGRFTGVHYSCGLSYNMFDHVTITTNRAFLQSERFPDKFSYNSKTWYECKAEFNASTKLDVKITNIDFNTTKTKISVTWDSQTETVSRTKSPPIDLEPKVAKNLFKIVFESDGEEGSGQFQLEFKANRTLTWVCNVPPQTLKLAYILAVPSGAIFFLIALCLAACLLARHFRKPANPGQIQDAQISEPADSVHTKSRPNSDESYCSSCGYEYKEKACNRESCPLAHNMKDIEKGNIV